MKSSGRMLALLLMLSALTTSSVWSQRTSVEDFTYPGAVPTKWRILSRQTKTAHPLPEKVERDDDFVEVVTLDGDKVLRVYTRDETVQVARVNGEEGFDWSTQQFPLLSWRWRAERLPEGARESRSSLNDTGAALYVSFDCNDWLGRLCSIKYTYSSTLPVGTTVRYGPLRVLVVSSAINGIGEWREIERDVQEDFRALFGKNAPERPLFIMVWGDTDNTHGVSDVYFDSIAKAKRK